MPQVEIISQSDDPGGGGWLFDAQAIDDEGRLRAISLRLSWADYNLWSATGSDPPETVARAALAFVLQRKPVDQWPMRLDASMARRWFTDADERIPRLIEA
jgi:hypothetical protein